MNSGLTYPVPPARGMLVVVVAILVMLSSSVVYSKVFTPKESPRMKKYADDRGCYSIIVRTSSDVINPGETLILEIFISGYGVINKPKLVFYPSPNVVDSDNDESRILFDLPKELPKDRSLYWGSHPEKLHSDGGFLDLSQGIKTGKWSSPTIFFDMNTENNIDTQISTEMLLGGNAPIQIYMKTKEKVLPGLHSIRFLFTYHNGSEWSNSEQTVDFTIRNIFQRNERWIISIGVIAALCAILPTLKGIIQLLKKIFWLIKNEKKGKVKL